MRLVAALVIVAGCGGSPAPAPAAAVAPIAPTPVAASEPAPPPPPPPESPPPPAPKPEQVAVADGRGGDPCEGGEATGIMAAGEGGGGAGLGTGSIGTIGHGSGTGSSGGFGRRASSPEPTVTLGEATVKGDLDKAIIRRYVKRNINKLRYCYEKQLLAKPDLHGKLVAKFTINDQGLTEDISTTTAFDPDVGACVVSVFKSIEFPKPKTGKVSVSYPFTFALPKK